MRITGIGIILLLIINFIIYLNRNNGFEYINALSIEQLYPSECDNNCINKWTKPDKKYSSAELTEGFSFLKMNTGIDTIKTDEIKIISIAAFLFLTYQNQMGQPSARLNHLLPLKQLELLSSEKSEHLWCGNFQSIFGYFCSCAGLPARYVEITSFPGLYPEDTHEVNEIYIEKYKKWVLVDVTRNMLMIKKNAAPLSAAEYFNFKVSDKAGTVQVLKATSNNSFIFDTVIAEKNMEDNYFNKNFFLRYYYMTDLQKVYDPLLKLKRYILPDSWYAVYDPRNNYTNYRFRLKQFFILLMGISLLLYLCLFLKKNKNSTSD